MLKTLQPLANCEPEYANHVEQDIYNDLADEANCTLAEWKLAKTRVFIDGNYGPISDDE